MYKVLRSIPGPSGKVIEPGQLVSGEGWKNVRSLIAAGKLAVVDASEDEPVKPAKKTTKKVTENVNL